MRVSWLIFLGLLGGILGFTPFYTSDFCSQTITNDCNTTFSYIDDINEAIYPVIQELVRTSYFRYFKINFDKQCKFWNEGHFCSTENCAVEILPPNKYNWDEVILDDLKPSKLGHINKHDSLETESCEDLDYCELDDENNCDYINLIDNPERFTGYGGKQAHTIWQAIYQENCFKEEDEKQCDTKQLFYRVISGMHSSISTHLANEYISPDSEDIHNFGPNLKVFMERVGEHNDRISNLYFNYGLISQAIIKLFKNYPIIEYLKQSDELIGNQDNYGKLFNDLFQTLNEELIFNTSLIIEPHLKDEFRSKFRNISSIMDCVGCDRCRMWGKLQTIGYGTALKILFEDNQNLKFRRIEIVSLINTFDRLSKSIDAVKNFKVMYLNHLQDVEKGLVQPGDFDKLSDKNSLSFPFMENSNRLKSKIGANKISKDEAKSTTAKVEKNDQEDTKYIKLRDRSLKKQFEHSMDEVMEALFFVLKAYKHFPMIILQKSLIKLNYWWNLFIGLDTNEYYQELELQQNYMSLFHE